MKLRLGALSLALLILSLTGASALASKWPVVRPWKETRTFADPTGEADTPFSAFIRDVRGNAVYKLECHNGNYDNETEMTFSGDFQCALFALGRDFKLLGTGLLAANTPDEMSSDWWNRGRMLANQLRGKCLKYPEYSTDRQFKLRGLLLTIRFSGMEWGPAKDVQGNPMLTKFTVTFSIVPDKSARTPRAALPPGPKPPEACYPG